MGTTRILAASLATCALVVACQNGSDQETLPPFVLGMQDTTAPTYDDGETQIYEVHMPVELPIRRPKDGERPSGDVDPYPDAPFTLAKDTRITVRFTLTNLEDHPNTFELLLDPWNEFVRYEPGAVVGDEETTPNFSGIDRFFILGPKERREGIITPDDMAELATDLATAMKIDKTPPAADSQFGGPALYNRAFNQQNRSSQPDVVLAPYIPAVVDGITGFDLGLRSYGGGGENGNGATKAAKVAVELVVDVEDVKGDRVVLDGDTSKPTFDRPGDVLTPPAAAAMQ
jgi:hypothetical protein